jgi:hypothetical protein
MHNCGNSHSFGDGCAARAFVMQDEALFIGCDKKAGELARAGFDANEISCQCSEAPLV